MNQANARLELALRGANIGIWENDMPDGDYRHGRVSYVNIWEQLGYGRPPDSASAYEAGMAPIHSEDRALVEEAIRSYLAGETSEYEVECRGRHKDGSYRWTLARGVAVRDAGGKPIRFVGSSVDITDRKRAEEALRESEERFRGTFENAAVGIAHTHPEGRFLRVNEKFCAIVGYPREELLEKTWHDITHPDDLAASIDVSAAALRGESPGLPLEKRYLRKDGSLVWGELVISLQRDAAGAPGYLIAIIQDISQRKRLEEALRESEKRFRTFVDHATDAFFLLDDRHVVLDVNRQACQSLGYTRDELVGMTPPDFDPDVTPANIEEINRKLNAGETVAFESRHRRKDGTVFPVEVRGQAFWEGGRRLRGGPGPGHHRAQAGRGGAARERAAVPHLGRGAAAHGLDCRAGRRDRLLQRPHHRVHWPYHGAAPGLGLAIDHPPRRSAPVPRAVDPLDRDRRALRDRVPGAPRRRRLPLAPRKGAGPPRRVGPDHQVVRVVHRHR